MRLYSWDVGQHTFRPAPVETHLPSSERALLTTLKMNKGERRKFRSQSEERLICLLRGSWSMKIAGADMIVRCDEGVLIPSGFEHSAEALEDSCALEIVPEHNREQEDYLWGV